VIERLFFKVFDHVGFFWSLDDAGRNDSPDRNTMILTTPTISQQLAEAAIAFQSQRTGHAPKSVSVVVNGDTLVITLQGVLSPAEQALAQSPEGAAKVQEFHQRLFQNASDTLRQEIKRITKVEVQDASTEVEATKGAVVKVFPTGTMVQVFLLTQALPAETWSGLSSGGPEGPPALVRPSTAHLKI
jgi:uncharacterized protein YbcI